MDRGRPPRPLYGAVVLPKRRKFALDNLMVLELLGPTFLIIDSLDECDSLHQRQLLAELRTLLPSTKSAGQG